MFSYLSCENAQYFKIRYSGEVCNSQRAQAEVIKGEGKFPEGSSLEQRNSVINSGDCVNHLKTLRAVIIPGSGCLPSELQS